MTNTIGQRHSHTILLGLLNKKPMLYLWSLRVCFQLHLLWFYQNIKTVGNHTSDVCAKWSINSNQPTCAKTRRWGGRWRACWTQWPAGCCEGWPLRGESRGCGSTSGTRLQPRRRLPDARLCFARARRQTRHTRRTRQKPSLRCCIRPRRTGEGWTLRRLWRGRGTVERSIRWPVAQLRPPSVPQSIHERVFYDLALYLLRVIRRTKIIIWLFSSITAAYIAIFDGPLISLSHLCGSSWGFLRFYKYFWRRKAAAVFRKVAEGLSFECIQYGSFTVFALY